MESLSFSSMAFVDGLRRFVGGILIQKRSNSLIYATQVEAW